MRIPIGLAAGLMLGAATAWAVGKAEDPYDLLARIPSPYDLIGPRMPSGYRVPVDISGPIADELRRNVQKMALSPPHFEEILGPNRTFSFQIANDDYPLETRSLISGILNPTEMMDVLLGSLLKYRDKEQFAKIKREASAVMEKKDVNGAAALLIRLAPRGERFGYTYEDLGAGVRESWLIKLRVFLDPATLHVLHLGLQRCSRIAGSDAAGTRSDTSTFEYSFGYDSLGGVALPSRMMLSVNGNPAVLVTAAYRQEGKYTVFDSRKLCFRRGSPSQETCMTMDYGIYDFGRQKPAKQTSPGALSEEYARQLPKAAALSRKAAEALKAGDISQAVRTLVNLVDSYPETPQAVEAAKLLDGLPR